MAILDNTARQEIRDAFMRRRNVGAVTKPDLIAAINATDDWIDGAQASFNAALPEPFKSATAIEQKTLLFCYVSLKRAGLLPNGGI